MLMEEKDQGKVQLKTILKGNAAMAIRPAAMAGLIAIAAFPFKMV